MDLKSYFQNWDDLYIANEKEKIEREIYYLPEIDHFLLLLKRKNNFCNQFKETGVPSYKSNYFIYRLIADDFVHIWVAKILYLLDKKKLQFTYRFIILNSSVYG